MLLQLTALVTFTNVVGRGFALHVIFLSEYEQNFTENDK